MQALELEKGVCVQGKALAITSEVWWRSVSADIPPQQQARTEQLIDRRCDVGMASARIAEAYVHLAATSETRL